MLFFIVSINGYELWKSDGSEAGTVRVKPLAVDPYRSYLTNVLGAHFFSAGDGISGQELWKTDGTEVGTNLVQDLWPGAPGSGPSEFTLVHDKVFFAANDYRMSRELWAAPLSALGLELDQGYLPLIMH
jgi:ELWxxDGT repeat protein